MKLLQLLLLCLFLFSGFSISAQVSFEADTVFLSYDMDGIYEGNIAIDASAADLADLRWEQIDRTLEPLVWTGFVSSCDSIFFPFSTAGSIVNTGNPSSCFLGVSIVSLEGDLPRATNQFRLQVTSISDPGLNQILTYILNPVSVGTKDLLPSEALQLSPNPMGDYLHIAIDETLVNLPVRITIFNSLGQVEYFQEVDEAHHIIRGENFSKGLLFLSMESEGGSVLRRVVRLWK